MAGPHVDIEAARDGDEYLVGFTDYSHYIASDLSLSIYRKFGILGARNLLYLQAEIQLVECQLKQIDKDDKKELAASHSNEKLDVEIAARSWEDLKQQGNGGVQKEAKKLQLIYELRKLMKEYEKALLRRNQVLQLEEPEKGPLEAVTRWFRTKRPFWGSGFHLFDDEEDLITLGSQVEPDRISSFMHRCLGYRLRKERKTPKSWGPMYYYPTERIALIVSIIGIFASAALLVGAIVTLYFVKPMAARLGIVGVFTVLFAGSVSLLTHARKVEVYAATAAYAAVLVVFVGVNH